MDFWSRIRTLDADEREQSEYPVWGMVLIMALLFLSPFTTGLLAYGAFLICVYRVLRYDERVFAGDYCALVPVSLLFRTTGGMSLLVYLSLFAGIWYFIRSKVQANSAVVVLLLLLNYLLARMQLDVGNFLLCFGQLFLLYVLLPRQDGESAERTIRVFCVSLLLSSFYALLLRDTRQLQAIRGAEVPAFLGSNFKRFQGLFQDPNYYMSLLIIGLALLLKLKDCGRIRGFALWSMLVCMTVFGILSYSKTFFLVFLLLVVIYIIWQFWNKRFFRGLLLALLGIGLGSVLLMAEDSPFAVVLTRLTDAGNLSELTTGRSDLLVRYLNAITKDAGSFFFGAGLAADNLKRDAHNLFVEFTYYTGIVGLILVLCFYGIMIWQCRQRMRQYEKQNMIAKYLVLLMAVLLYCTLSGMLSVVSYAAFFLAIVSILLTKEAK